MQKEIEEVDTLIKTIDRKTAFATDSFWTLLLKKLLFSITKKFLKPKGNVLESLQYIRMKHND